MSVEFLRRIEIGYSAGINSLWSAHECIVNVPGLHRERQSLEKQIGNLEIARQKVRDRLAKMQERGNERP